MEASLVLIVWSLLTAQPGKNGFNDAEFVILPVSRHVIIYGTREPMCPRIVNRKFIARINTLLMRRAHAHVYSQGTDFCWLDEELRSRPTGRCQPLRAYSPLATIAAAVSKTGIEQLLAVPRR